MSAALNSASRRCRVQNGSTALHVAAKNGKYEVLSELLVKFGADITAEDKVCRPLPPFLQYNPRRHGTSSDALAAGT